MSTTKLHTTHLKFIIGALLLLAVLGLSSCALFQTPNKYVTHVQGRVAIEGITDYSGINVQVQYYDSDAQRNMILDAMVTDSSGYFDIPDVPLVPDGVNYSVYAWRSGYAPADESFSIYYGYDGSPFVFNSMKLHRQKKMVFDWAWKEGDGSSFMGAETGQKTLYSYVVSPSKGKYYCYIGPDDTDYYSGLRFYDDDDQATYVYYGHHLWDAGPVPLSSVASKPSSPGYSYHDTTMQVGHTYVIETATGYAKFHVISIGNAE